ncbi:MAG: hypothetical protein SFU53_09355 [Terrimicrobiaceae bacterium]|nr:hypothetical protein [Terrimicrobiaceae bacterium]
MKAFLAFALLTGSAWAGDSESTTLAAGYAAAFRTLDRPTAQITYVTESTTETIRGVRQIEAHAGVVAIRTRSGTREILDPARIVRISAE